MPIGFAVELCYPRNLFGDVVGHELRPRLDDFTNHSSVYFDGRKQRHKPGIVAQPVEMAFDAKSSRPWVRLVKHKAEFVSVEITNQFDLFWFQDAALDAEAVCDGIGGTKAARDGEVLRAQKFAG